MYRNLDDIQLYCWDHNWGGNDEEPILQSTIDAAREAFSSGPEPYEITSEDLGYITFTYRASNKNEILLIIEEESHTVGFYTNNMEIEKTFKNKKIKETVKMVGYLAAAYQYFY